MESYGIHNLPIFPARPLSSSDPPHSGSIYLPCDPSWFCQMYPKATGGNIWHPLKDWHLTDKYTWRHFCPATSTWYKLILNSQGFAGCNLRYYSPSLQGNIAASERPETVLHVAIVIRNKRWNWGVGRDGQDFNKDHDNAIPYARLSTNLSVLPHSIVLACPLILQ